MDYVEIDITIPGSFPEGREIAVAMLELENYDIFLETPEGIITCIAADKYDEQRLSRHALFRPEGNFRFSFRTRNIPSRNWNEEWEKNFKPVSIDDQIVVRAPFHKVKGKFRHDIVIEPRMAFGTGHHETTGLMMRLMLETGARGKRVADLGCGTGILAILASKMGASGIAAIDNDPTAVENCIHNLEVNNISGVDVSTGDAAGISEKGRFDLLVANITLNILTESMKSMAGALNNGGILLVSGFYSNETDAVEEAALHNNLVKVKFIEKNRWVAGMFSKP